MEDDQNPLTGGSGGGTGMDDDGNNLQSCNATYQIAGNQVAIISRKAPPINPLSPPGPSSITLLAGGGPPTFEEEGRVDIRGAKGVRITAGGVPMPLMNPPVTDPATNGVEIVVGETQSVKIHRGLLPLDQVIEMLPTGITVNAGIGGTLTLQAGLNKIVISPENIIIQGLFVFIN